MDIEETPIYKEIKEIIDDGPKPISYYYKAKIHVKDEDFELIKVIAIDNVSDYITRVGDITRLEVMVPLGLWAKKIYKERANLEITLLRMPLIEVGEKQDEEEPIETQRFFAIPNPLIMPVVDGKDVEKLTMRELDLKGTPVIEFQLTDKLLHKLRLITTGGIFRRSTAEDVVKYILDTNTKKIKVEEEISFKGVDFIEGDNKEKREHFIIPQGTNIVDLPVFAQRRMGGVYNTGLGCYYTRRYWFVYPLYDTTRLEKATKTLTIIKVPTIRNTGMERTYRQEGDTTYIIGTSDSEITDDALSNFTDSGNGTRFADSRKHIRDFTALKDNKSVASRKKSNHEFMIVDREEEKNSIFLSSRKTNSNPFVERSELASKYGGVFRFNWENADPSVLFPGMMCKIHYLNNNKVKELHGVLLGHEDAVQLHGQGITPKRHITSVALTIFVNPPKGQDEDPSDQEDSNGSGEKEPDWTKYEAI